MDVLIVGAGGHAQVVADILLRMKDVGHPVDVLGYLDDDPSLQGRVFLGLPVMGQIAQISSIAHDAVMVAIGNNGIRRRFRRTP